MPELPEVETVLRTLEHMIRGAEIADIEIRYPKTVLMEGDLFRGTLIGKHFEGFIRRGKYLLFEMEDVTLVVHLRMEGKFYVTDDTMPVDKHTHVIFYLKDGRQLRYHDVRKFGRMEIIEKRDDYEDFKDLGPEPFSDRFNRDYCKKEFEHCNIPIKTRLLDQHFVAGIGNIYADEIVYMMKVHPKTACKKLKDEEIDVLIDSARKILKKAIQAGGTTIRSYTSSLGVTGLFQLSLNCHEQKECPRCGTPIKKITLGGRGTYFCPNCQAYKRQAVAITGTIGSGKSTVAEYLRKKGYYVFSCDEYNAFLLEKGQEGYKKIREVFPECFEGEELNKQKIASRVFKDPEKKKKLEGILHPLILKQMEKVMQEHDLFFAEVPLLFEVSWQKYFDTTLLVVTDEKIALKRLRERGLTMKKALARIANQMPAANKKKLADEIIYNNGSLEDLEREIERWIDRIC